MERNELCADARKHECGYYVKIKVETSNISFLQGFCSFMYRKINYQKGYIEMINHYRKKYEKYMDSKRIMKHKPGGNDVHKLCDGIEEFNALVKWMSTRISTDDQNEVNNRLFRITERLK